MAEEHQKDSGSEQLADSLAEPQADDEATETASPGDEPAEAVSSDDEEVTSVAYKDHLLESLTYRSAESAAGDQDLLNEEEATRTFSPALSREGGSLAGDEELELQDIADYEDIAELEERAPPPLPPPMPAFSDHDLETPTRLAAAEVPKAQRLEALAQEEQEEAALAATDDPAESPPSLDLGALSESEEPIAASADELRLVDYVPPVDELVPLSAEQSLLNIALTRAIEADPQQIIDLLTAELEVEPDQRRQALLRHELGHLFQTVLEDESRAVNAYAQALNLDPVFRPNIWAIRRIFQAGERWTNLVKLHDAETRFETEPQRRAEVLLEKGWILEQKIGDEEQAKACYWEAHQAHPSWLAPLLALERLAIVQADLGALATIYPVLAQAANEPGRRVAVLLELARVQEQMAGGAPELALQTLESALEAGGDRLTILYQMELVAAAAGRHQEVLSILRRQADALQTAESSDGQLAAGKLRRAAHIARKELDQQELAQELLASASALAPEDLLLQQDLLALAEERGDWSQVETLLSQQLERVFSPAERAALYHQLAITRLERGAPTQEVQDALAQALELQPAYLPSLLEQELEALRASDIALLTQVWQTVAEGAAAGAAGLSLAEPDLRWAALAFWRAGKLVALHLGQPDRARELLQRALDLQPSCLPAAEDLERLLLKEGRFEELAVLLEAQLQVAGSPERTDYLHETLAALAAGTLNDPDLELRQLAALTTLHPEDDRLLRRQAHALEGAGRNEELEQVLRQLEAMAADDQQRARWMMSRGRLLEARLQRPTDAAELYQRVLELQPGDPFAFFALEGLLVREGRHDDLARLLRQAADEAAGDPLGAVRRAELLWRLSSHHRQLLGQPAQAVAVLSELLDLDPGQEAVWFELAQVAAQTGDWPKVAEALEALAARSQDPAERSRLLLRHSEVLTDRLSDEEGAEELLQEALQIAPEPAQLVEALESLGHLRRARGDYQGADQALAQLEGMVPNALRAALLEERAWLAAVPLADSERAVELVYQLQQLQPDNVRALLERGALAARRRDAAVLAETQARLAEATEDAALSVAFDLRAGIMADAAGDPAGSAADSYRRALHREPQELEAILGLLARGDLNPAERAELLARLREGSPATVYEDMRLPLAEALERAGRFAESGKELAAVLQRDPDNLPALLILQRLAQAAGQLEFEAQAWTNIARLYTDRSAKSESYSKAAALLLELKRPEDAAVLLRQVLSLKPADEQAYQRLRDLYQELGDQRGLEQLLSHRIGQIQDSSLLVGLHFERSELRLARLQDVVGAARDLWRILSLDPRHLEALRQLARLYDEDGNWSKALLLWQRYADATDSTGLQRPAFLRIAEILHQQQGRSAQAIDICRRFLEREPDDVAVLRQLAGLYEEVRDFPHAISTLERLVDVQKDREAKAEELRRIGGIYLQGMKDVQEARAVLVRARDLAPTSTTVVDDLRRLERESGMDQDVERLLERATDDLREALALEPLSLTLYRRLMQVSEWAADGQALIAALGALLFFGETDEREAALYQRRIAQVGFQPRQQLGAQVWREILTPTDARSASGEIWSVVAEVVPRLYEGRLPQDPSALGVGKAERVDRRDDGPVSGPINRIAAAFGLPEFELYLKPQQPRLVTGLAAERSALIVGQQVMDDFGPAERFQVGRALSLLRDKAFALEVLTRDELELLFSAVIYTVEPGAAFSLQREQVEAESRRLGKVLPRKARRILPLAVARYLQEGGSIERWITGVLVTASRAGLLASGDIVSSLEQMVPELSGAAVRGKLGQPGLIRTLENNQLARELLIFSLNQSYLDLRRKLHL